MVNIIYIEEELQSNPKANLIASKYKNANVIYIKSYGEVFNRKKQSFRAQKANPSLILAKKYGRKVIPTPKLFTIGREHNYYFSHILNCPYDCKYCFLQGMYRSADYVYFINSMDYKKEILEIASKHPPHTCTFFSGYDGDSLALDAITGFCDDYIPFFQKHLNIDLEIRTKSVNIKPLLKLPPTKNMIIAYTLTPDVIAKNIETKTPSLQSRLKAIKSLQDHGWTVGLRFDPIIYFDKAKDVYKDFFYSLEKEINLEAIHSVTTGPFRLPQGLGKRMKKDNPQELLFSSYQDPRIVTYCNELLSSIFDKRKIFCCVDETELVKNSLPIIN